MRIAAGVLLIIAAISNGLAGATYGLGSAATAAAGSEEAQKALAEGFNKQDTSKMTPEQKAQYEKMKSTLTARGNSDSLNTAAAGLGAFGIFLLLMLGLQIGGGVCLFMQKAAKYVMVVAVLGLAAEIIGPAVFGVNFGVMNIIGLVASVLAFLAAKGYAGGTGAASA